MVESFRVENSGCQRFSAGKVKKKNPIGPVERGNKVLRILNIEQRQALKVLIRLANPIKELLCCVLVIKPNQSCWMTDQAIPRGAKANDDVARFGDSEET